MNPTNKDLRQAIDEVAKNATKQLATYERQNVVRSQLPCSVLLLLIAPLLMVVLQALRWSLGLGIGEWFSWTAQIALSIFLPVSWLAMQAWRNKKQIHRVRALATMDAALGSSERVVTADQFLRYDSRDGFMQAAVEDAAKWVERGQRKNLNQQGNKVRLGWSMMAIPTAILIMTIAAWLAGLSRIHDASSQHQQRASLPLMDGAAVEQQQKQPKPRDDERADASPPEEHDPKTGRNRKRKNTVATLTPNAAEESRGRLTDGEASESQQTSNPSNAQGDPSSQGQPADSGEQTPRKPKKPKNQTNTEERPPRQAEEEQEPSGATAGQGSSKGSRNSAATSDWASRGQEATPDDENVEDEDDVEDEDEEQKSRGGVQPNMRDRRAPVNRDLQIGFGSNRPNPDANGRGGPGGQKKSRGVASLVLGVPIPDRINGQPNKGRIRVTQQRVTPEAEESERVLAERRAPRTGNVGPIHHPTLSPWLQDIVRRYFLARRKGASTEATLPIQTPTSATSPSAESNDPQS
ncbi:MAG TPA: hypothetical protein EYQ75_15965 [Planctomycetaceae bacterium]|nr:hypothetical protein [Planctomycetaceae bacterium]